MKRRAQKKKNKKLVEIFGPPEDGHKEYLDQVGELMSLFETKLVHLSDDEATTELQDVIDEEACPTSKLLLIFQILKDYLRLDIAKTAERGAMHLLMKDDKGGDDTNNSDAQQAGATTLDDDKDVRRRQMKIAADEKFRMAFLVRAGMADEAELLEMGDEQDEDRVEVELSEVEPTFLRGLSRRKHVNFRNALPSEVLRNANPQQRNAILLRQATKAATDLEEEPNTMKRAAQLQAQRNTDRRILKSKERRQQQYEQQQQRGGGGPASSGDRRGRGDADNGDDDAVPQVNLILETDTGESKAEDEHAYSARSKLPDWMKKMVGDQPAFGKGGYRSKQQQQSGGGVDRELINKQRKSLPIYDFKDTFIQHVRTHSTTVLVGETGSGKTTQIPQYLLEAGFGNDGLICCTQPRRVAAETLARRVADEVGCTCGAEVGYTVRFKDNTSSLTKIKYMTDGMLLREALLDDTFQRYSVIILDEAHERSINTDVLFGIVKKAVEKRPSLKIVVTSATLDTGKFCEYFGASEPFFIKGRTFPVETHYLQEPCDDYVETSILTVLMIHLKEAAGDILVFLTGQEEIDNAGERLVHQMEELKKSVGDSIVLPELLVLPLTATMPEDVQQKVFDPTPAGCRKVVLATNVAETSITIDNLYYVVDAGFCKQNRYDAKVGLEQLLIVPVSQAQANQRSGRAGRIGPGKAYRLYTEDQYDKDMEAATVPEIQRSNLFHIVLQLKAVGVNDLINFDFMDKPPMETLVGALQKLRYLEALDDDGILTAVGRRMAQLPVDPSQAKTLLTAADLNCAGPVLTIVSMLAVQKKGIFYRPRDKQEIADAKKRAFHQPEGDQLTLMTVYNQWIESGMSEAWAQANFVKHRLLMEARDTREQLQDMLTKRGTRELNQSANKDPVAIRKAITAGYFFNAAKRTNNDMYVTLSDRREVALHPSSSLRELVPKYVIYDELHMTSREYMREVMAIDPAWLTELAPSYYARPKPGKLTKEQMCERLVPTLRAWESGASWRISKQRRKT
ncbi:ATP-dependent pre-mRNA splicing factor, putative [Bodo saltans]|uniref:RNA helicase n=1 Tax=Bodo saltans TaxID=75058 RepID=A0A0S4JCY8_BODSA|nr:ATP-dependent pre-mRNA splicing factor, putative [Bodo saltans]|eukprot:CUG88013.1 ATP-dependent pre-mRNA splicing factor, putative [Bodo saltans]